MMSKSLLSLLSLLVVVAVGSARPGYDSYDANDWSDHGVDGNHYDGSHYDGSPYDGSHYDGNHYDGSPYDGSHYDGSHYDGSPYDGSPYDGSHYDGSPYDGSHYDGSHYDALDWLDDRYDDGHDYDGYNDENFHLFLTISKSLRSAQFDSISLSRLYKTFLRGVLHKKLAGGRLDYGLRRYGSDDHDDHDDHSDDWDDYFDDDDFHYKYDDDLKEEKAKRLFLYYLKFRAHYQAQREIERVIRHTQEKARKQYALFSELVAYVHKVKTQLEIAEKFSKFVDLNLKLKFASFKNCFYHEHCDHDDDHDFDAYRSGELKQCFSMEGGHDYDNEGKHYELFLKLYKSVSLISHSQYSHDDVDSFPGWGFHNDHDGHDDHDDDDDDDDDDWKDKHPIYRYFAYLHKYLYNNNTPLEFWGRQRNFKDQAYEKFLFFALRAYKELREEKAMRDRQEKLEAIFSHFHRFITYQEDHDRINSAFYKFQKWHEVSNNQAKLEEFASFLKKVSQVKGSGDHWSGNDELIQNFEHVFEYNQHDYRDGNSDDYNHDYHDNSYDYNHDYLFSNYGYRKQRSHW